MKLPGTVRRVLARGVVLGALSACLPALAALVVASGTPARIFSPSAWPFELGTHFPVQSVAVLAPALLVLLGLRRWWTAGLVLLCLLAAAGRLVPSGPAPAHAGSNAGSREARRLRILSANVHVGSEAWARFGALVEAEDPDVIVVVEVNDPWIAGLEPLRARYPYTAIYPSEQGGVAVYARLPLRAFAYVAGDLHLPFIDGVLEVGGREVELIAAHASPPISPKATEARDAYLRRVGDLAGRARGPVVVAGDLNTTRWSPIFPELLARGDLGDGRVGRGILATWPVALSWLAVPIDHVLVGGGAWVESLRVGPDFGSDHLPLIADVTL